MVIRRCTLLLAAIVLTLLLGWNAAARANPVLDALGDNAWVKLDPVPTFRYTCADRNHPYCTQESILPGPIGRSYSGIHYGNGKIFYFGGGHNSYPGNDVEIYDIESNTWTQQYQPEVCPESNGACTPIYGGSAVGFLSPNNRPYTLHTYDMIAWDPIQAKFILRLRPAGDFTYDPATVTWERFATTHPFGDDVNTHNIFAYDPDVGFISMVTAEAGRGVNRLQNNDWVSYGFPPDNTWSTPYSVYIPDLKFHLVMSTAWASEWWKYDAVNNTWAALTNVPAAVAHDIDSFDYDTLNKVVIAVQHHLGVQKVWSYNPATNVWTQLPITTSVPSLYAVSADATAPLLRYDPIHNVFVFLDPPVNSGGALADTWAYRYSRGGTPPPPTYGSLRIERVGADGQVGSAPSTSAWVDSGTPSAYNPLYLSPIQTGVHQVSASNVSGYVITAGTCTSPQGAAECTVSNFPLVPTCNATSCTLSASVSENQWTKVVFKYVLNPCTYSISPASYSASSSTGKGTVNVTTNLPSCSWIATRQADWITITSGSSGTGNGTVKFSVRSNPDRTSRTGTITIADKIFTVTQAGKGKK